MKKIIFLLATCFSVSALLFPMTARGAGGRVYLPLVLAPYRPPEDMATIPAGSFQMGCNAGAEPGSPERCGRDEQPQHSVYLDSFKIDRHETTNAEYAVCVGMGTCTPPRFRFSRTRSSYYENPKYASYPVMYVDWYQAAAYCTWAGRRLPTEAEWEKAARGPDARPYPWGEDLPGCARANLGFCTGDTSAVGSYPTGASPYGVMDLAGNVWEWVADWYGPGYYSSSPDSNPSGPASGTHKVIRGGSWFHGPELARSSHRFEMEPGRLISFGVGFRCAR